MTGPRKNHVDPVTEELMRELKHMRVVLREAGEAFILRREGEVETLLGHLEALPAGRRKKEAPCWLQVLKSLKLKPEKGRMKDLRSIAALIEVVTEGVVSCQERERRPGNK